MMEEKIRLLLYKESEEAASPVAFALLCGDSLTEYHRFPSVDSSSINASSIGELRLGRITQVQKNLCAAFVDIGCEKQAFLPMREEELSSFKNGDEIIVEIKKEPYGNKGATVTHHFSIRGDSVVLSYGNTLLGVSKKITDEKERVRLKQIASTFPKADNIGYVLRTESRLMPQEALQKEASLLLDTYATLTEKARYSRVGALLWANAMPVADRILQIPDESLKEILIDDRNLYSFIEEILLRKSPSRAQKMRLYEKSGHLSMASVYRIQSQLQDAVRKRVNLSGSLSGGYLFIEQTEALCAIDVNTGKEISGKNKEDAVTAFNQSVCSEIARQIRLRNLSGMILIDFIDMEREENRRKVLAAMEDAMKEDPREHHILDFTALHLMELTRARRGTILSV